MTQQTLGSVLEVQKRGLIGKTDWTSGGIRKDDIFFDGEAAATHNFVFTLLYAKGKVAKASFRKPGWNCSTPNGRAS